MLNETKVFQAEGITLEVVDSLYNQCPPSEIKVHACTKAQKIIIRNGTVYLTNLMPNNGLGYVELIGFLVELYEASQVYRLPDVEFAYWHDDNAPGESERTADGKWKWPFAPHGLPPLLAWSKAAVHGAVLVPYCGAFRCPRDSFDAIMGEVHNLSFTPFSQRSEVAFGRWNIFCAWYYRGALKTADGQPAPCPRAHYDELHHKYPQLLLTAAMGRNTSDGTLAHGVPLHSQHKHKYLVSTDGWSISSKFDKYLLLGSAILKAEGLTYGWYYPALRPYEHYLPIMSKHKDDILEVLEWAKAHEAEAEAVGQRAQTFAMRNLNRPMRLCYIFRLLTELSKYMKYTPDCSRRAQCVPLVEEIKFLAKHDHHAHKCRYQEVLAQYGYDDPDGKPGFSGYEELKRKHEEIPAHAGFG
ncbi:hypothetical protein HYH03_003753 [Edaphochlamys debaryana]|uniref:Glycosyl transferase CAP10 domain-containing protein n=1 Tax=Edaphochlamys debaryana TaxID=47281 RepID=A0A835YBK7_9CHLO|nr:hypothetical protein HYH03_003753 [Edaphochlamys debaryana]|eukprot:KAG2498502.1 hypothetical protein HYH03_003753 [Edaphochlamys debaryana]